jgi:hypothetical protein
MIVKIREQLAVLLESFVEPRPVSGVQFMARGLTPCDQLRTLQVAHANQPIYGMRHFGWLTHPSGDPGHLAAGRDTGGWSLWAYCADEI